MRQLPISNALASTFPKLKASCFIIVNPKTNLVVHERNSRQRISVGTFKNVISDDSSIGDENEAMSTLTEMSRDFRECNISNITKKINGINICFFNSVMSGVGCAFLYQNTNSSEFICLIFGEESENSAMDDARNISSWLDQFFEYKIPKSLAEDITIPVIYGTRPSIHFIDQPEHHILLSKKFSQRVNKIWRYRTIMRAPIHVGDELGYILYQTDIFKNPITKIIKATENIEKAGWFKCICDSVRYLIFGSTMNISKKRDD